MSTRRWGIASSVNHAAIGVRSGARVATLAAGRFVVVWLDGPSVSATIRFRLFSQTGTPLGDEAVLASGGGFGRHEPSVAALADGGFYITWTEAVGVSTTTNYILGRVFGADGTLLRDQPVVFGYGAEGGSSAARLGDGVAVAWHSGTTNDLFYRKFDAAGTGGAVWNLTPDLGQTNLSGLYLSVASSPDHQKLVAAFMRRDVISVGLMAFSSTSEQAVNGIDAAFPPAAGFLTSPPQVT